jgi:hypothetical protein
MHLLFSSWPIILAALFITVTISTSTPSDEPWATFPIQNPGDSPIEGSKCTKGLTLCPTGTTCRDTLYNAGGPYYCLHPDRLDMRRAFDCKTSTECSPGNFCRIGWGNDGVTRSKGGNCESLKCRCGMGANLCIDGTRACEMLRWGDRGGGCITKAGEFANCGPLSL